MLRTGQLLHPASTPASRPTPGVSLPGTLASPRTGLAPAGSRELVARLRHEVVSFLTAPELLDAQLGIPGGLGQHRPWPSPSSTSASAGSSASSSRGEGPSRTRSSRSWCSATRCACSSDSSTNVSATGPSTGRSSPHSVDGSLGRVGRPSSLPPTPWCAGTGNSPGASGDGGEHGEARDDPR